MPPETPPAPKNGVFQKASFLIYLLVVSGIFLYMLRHFLMPVFMAAVFTGLSYPLYFWLLMKTQRRVLSALLTLGSLVLLLVVPLIAVGLVAYQEAVHFFATWDLDALRAAIEKMVVDVRSRFPGLLRNVNAQDLSRMAFGAFQNSFQFIVKNSANISLSVFSNLVNFFLMLFMMFYFYIDGHHILQKLIRWSPLKDEYEKILIEKFVSVSKGTLKGILIIGVIQGMIGTILFFAVGLNSPVFLGALMVFGSVIPAMGTAIVWVPVALMFVFQGKFILALVVAGVGGIIISSVDNLIRPMVVGKDIKMHDLLVLLSTLGGLGLFGLPGFIIGPIIASLFLSVWNIFEEIFADELAQNRITGSRTQKISQILREPPGTAQGGETP